MFILHLRCSSETCTNTPGCYRHCRANIVVNHGRAPMLPGQVGTPLPAEARERVAQFLPYLCSKAQLDDNHHIEVASDPQLSRDAEDIFFAMLDSPLALSAWPWFQSIMRSPDEVPVLVTDALATAPGGGMLDVVLEARDTLFRTPAVHALN